MREIEMGRYFGGKTDREIDLTEAGLREAKRDGLITERVLRVGLSEIEKERADRLPRREL